LPSVALCFEVKKHKSVFWSIKAVSEKTTFLIMYWRLNFWSICQHYIHPSLFPVIHSPWLAPLSWVGGGTTRLILCEAISHRQDRDNRGRFVPVCLSYRIVQSQEEVNRRALEYRRFLPSN